MAMTPKLQLLRQRIVQTPVNRRGHRQYGSELRQDICSYAAKRHAQGDSHNETAKALGLPGVTLSHWLNKTPVNPQRKKQPVGFRPVALRASKLDTTGLQADNLGHSTQVRGILPTDRFPTTYKGDLCNLTDFAVDWTFGQAQACLSDTRPTVTSLVPSTWNFESWDFIIHSILTS